MPVLSLGGLESLHHFWSSFLPPHGLGGRDGAPEPSRGVPWQKAGVGGWNHEPEFYNMEKGVSQPACSYYRPASCSLGALIFVENTPSLVRELGVFLIVDSCQQVAFKRSAAIFAPLMPDSRTLRILCCLWGLFLFFLIQGHLHPFLEPTG